MSRPILPASAYEALGLSVDTIEGFVNVKPSREPPNIAAPNLLQSDEDSARPMAPNETSIKLYAELLLHIRTVTLFASLRTNFSQETKAKLSADKSCITVSHEGHTATIRLPINVKGGGDAALSLPSQPPSKEITLRLQMEETEDSNILGLLHAEERKLNLVPWDGASLSQAESVEIVCKNCNGILVPKEKISQWRDLPNENWAEMMDFWHCHKPDEHHLHDHTHEEVVGRKGYAAGNSLQATEGVGYVDLTSFLLKMQDCEGAQITTEHDSQNASIICKHCNSTIGNNESTLDGWRIWKWSIRVLPSPPPPLTLFYSVQKWISARLLYLIENTGLRKFHIHSPPQTTEPPAPIPSILIWVFTPDLLFSSSTPSPLRNDPTRSMKVFYKKQTWQPLQPGEPESATEEDVEFPKELFDELEAALVQSQRLLPPTTRKFQGWDVALLERFSGPDVGINHTEGEHEDEGVNGLAGDEEREL